MKTMRRNLTVEVSQSMRNMISGTSPGNSTEYLALTLHSAPSPEDVTAEPAAAYASIYQHLDVDKKEIRVLHLQPGRGKAPVICRMHVVSLLGNDVAEPPLYDALSYTWGSSSEGKMVLVQTETLHSYMPVTNNLHAALQNMRPRRGKPLVLWVDAICINQSRNAEKSTQVAGMGAVFSSAKRVRVWLGEPLTRKYYPLRYYGRVIRRYARSFRYPGLLRSHVREDPTILKHFFDLRLHSMDDSLATAERQWHSRAWVRY